MRLKEKPVSVSSDSLQEADKSTATLLDCLIGGLEYPDKQSNERVGLLLEVLRDSNVELFDKYHTAFEDYLGLTEDEKEELFIIVFDLNPTCFFYAGYQIIGEDFRRGILMAELKSKYAICGIDIGSELPDFIPLLLKLYTKLEDVESALDLNSDLILPALDIIVEKSRDLPSYYSALINLTMTVLSLDLNHTGRAMTVYPKESSALPTHPGEKEKDDPYCGVDVIGELAKYSNNSDFQGIRR